MSTLAALNGHGFRRPPTPAGVLLRSALPPILMAMPLFEFCIPTTGTKVPSGPEEALLSAPLHQVAAAISKTLRSRVRSLPRRDLLSQPWTLMPPRS